MAAVRGTLALVSNCCPSNSCPPERTCPALHFNPLPEVIFVMRFVSVLYTSNVVLYLYHTLSIETRVGTVFVYYIGAVDYAYNQGGLRFCLY